MVFLLPATLGAAVVGRVTSAAGVAIEHARIRAEGGGETVFSDSSGRFRLAAEPPVELLVSHPRFKEKSVTVEPPLKPHELLVVLDAKQEIYEEIAVTANRGEDAYAPVSVSVAVIEPRAAMAALSGLVSEVAAVSENGQGGLFQSYSVRGVARGRVLTLLDGMRIVSERRAGVSASFVDPALIGSVDVLKGPSSTYYGSGALGGVVQLFPKDFGRLTLDTGLESQGSGLTHRYLAMGSGTKRWSLGLARRDADSSETPSGAELNSGFGQTSASSTVRWSRDNQDLRLTAIASLADEIGKSNTDFPLRTTSYPKETHLLLRLALQTGGGSTFDAWVHPQALETRVTESDGGRSEVDNESLGFGASWQSQSTFGEDLSARVGV
ncbi:MAG: TonB-dependent receptor plug domain-containing protein, partial [Acidobacteriota bacterium]|nr:TonB-dependent receptor plug domain-containing protein [Acidobacteriota bacterium]